MKNGIIGTFTGKVGNIIGCKWRGVNYVRSLPIKKQRVSTPAQLKQRAKFSLMTRFLFNFKNLLSFSFSNYALQMTGANEALSYNLRYGIKGEYPNLELDYADILLSRGKLKMAQNAIAKAGEAGAVDFSWVNSEEEYPANGSDYAMLIIYNPSTKLGSQVLQGSIRQSGTASLTIAANRGCAVETWLAFQSYDNKCFSNSIYTGRVITT